MKIAILGYGTVGKGLVEMIEGNKDKRNIEIEGILVRLFVALYRAKYKINKLMQSSKIMQSRNFFTLFACSKTAKDSNYNSNNY